MLTLSHFTVTVAFSGAVEDVDVSFRVHEHSAMIAIVSKRTAERAGPEIRMRLPPMEN